MRLPHRRKEVFTTVNSKPIYKTTKERLADARQRRLEIQNKGTDEEYLHCISEELSDGYHSFKELYYHRMVLFAVVCNTYKDLAWKSKLHADGTMFDGYFITGIETPAGNYTYHYHIDYWDKFDVKELPNAPEWDGHQAKDVDRLFSLIKG